AHVGDLLHGDVPLAAGERKENATQCLEILPVVARVAHADPVALTALDGDALRVAPDGVHPHHVGVVDREAVARKAVSFEDEVEEVPAGDTLRVRAPG